MVLSTSFVVSLAALVLVSVAAGNCGTDVCDDEVVLLQTKKSAPVKAHSFGDINGTKSEFPDLGKIADEVKKAAEEGGVKGAVESAENMVVAKAMKAIASTLNSLLDSLGKEVETLEKEGDKSTEKLKTAMEAANATVKAKTEVLDSKIHQTLDTVMEKWKSFAASLETMGTSISGALKMAGKPKVAEHLGEALNSTVEQLNGYALQLNNVEASVDNISQVSDAEVATKIEEMKNHMDAARDEIVKFPDEFASAFKKLSEGIIESLPKELPEESRKSVIEAFASVQAKADSLTKKISTTAENTLSSIDSAADQIPVKMVEHHSGAAGAGSCLGLLAAFVAAINM